MNKITEKIWVLVEQRDSAIAGVSFELIAKAKELTANSSSEVIAVILGYRLKDCQDKLVAAGADKVYVLDNQDFLHYSPENYSVAIMTLAKEHRPDIILAGATTMGRSLASRLAIRLETGITADCTDLYIDDKSGDLIQVRPAFGGNVLAKISCPNHRPQIATVRPRTFKALDFDFERKGEVLAFSAPKNAIDNRVRFLSFFKEELSDVNLLEAEIIIAGGRGLGSKKNFQTMESLAKKINAAVGASRSAVDAGWIPYIHQVGQTGTTVSPKIYFALGISGQIQHLVGMQSSTKIVAVNKDPKAPIFNVADYGIVGDANEFIQEMLKTVK